MIRWIATVSFVLVMLTGLGASAATFDWSPDNSAIIVEGKTLRQTVAGVTVRAQGYTVEYTATASRVFGPYPTGRGAGGLRIFGVDLRELENEQLGLISQPLPGIAVAGSDRGGNGLAPGFDNLPYRSGGVGVTKLDMAVFEFSKPVRINAVTVDDVSNFGRDIWMAAGTSAPDFTQGLVAALTPFRVRNSDDDIGGGPSAHQFGASVVRYLLVGARPREHALGRITSVRLRSQAISRQLTLTRESENLSQGQLSLRLPTSSSRDIAVSFRWMAASVV